MVAHGAGFMVEDGPGPPLDDKARAARRPAEEGASDRGGKAVLAIQKGVMEERLRPSFWRLYGRIRKTRRTDGVPEGGARLPLGQEADREVLHDLSPRRGLRAHRSHRERGLSRHSRKSWATCSSTSSSWRRYCKEKGRFDIKEVIGGVYDKMYRRHPHVFSRESDERPVEKRWEEIKKAEKAGLFPRLQRAANASRPPPGLRGLEEGGKVGFDWEKLGRYLCRRCMRRSRS